MTSKIRIRVGDIEVEYEGSDTFLDTKLPGLISKISEMAGGVPAATDKGTSGDTEKRKPPSDEAPGTLAAFLKKSNVGTNKTKKFLATAEWLHLKGRKQLKTTDVVEALSKNHQASVGNAAQCLNTNVKAGRCEKEGTEFFVTPDGRATLK